MINLISLTKLGIKRAAKYFLFHSERFLYVSDEYNVC